MSSRLEHTCWLPLFGLPMRMYTNSAALVELIETEQPLGAWASLNPTLVDSGPALEVEVLIREESEQTGNLNFCTHGSIILGGDGERMVLTDIERGYALAYMTTEALDSALGVIWEIGMLFAQRRGRVAMRAVALANKAGDVVCLMGGQLDNLIQICMKRGLNLLAHRVAHIHYGETIQIWGDGAGGELLVCRGPIAVCLVEQGAGRASQISDLPTSALEELGSVVGAVRAAYWLRVGSDLAMAAALVEHVLGNE